MADHQMPANGNGNGERVAAAVNSALLTLLARGLTIVGVPLLVTGVGWAGSHLFSIAGDLREIKVTQGQNKELLEKDIAQLKLSDKEHERRLGNIETYIWPPRK